MDKAAFDETFTYVMVKLSLTPSEEQTRQFMRFYELLHDWSLKINLTTITRQQDVIKRHFADSLAPMALIADWNERFGAAHVMDVGTGAGFPGIPLKIMNPKMKITLLDSLRKRTKFLDEAVRELDLKDAEILNGRAEDAGRDDSYREKYDLCLSRAVAYLSTLAEYCLPFVKVGGFFIAYKSDCIEEELAAAQNAIAQLGGEVKDTLFYQARKGSHSLVVIEKISPTPEKYPRRAGMPGKKPL